MAASPLYKYGRRSVLQEVAETPTWGPPVIYRSMILDSHQNFTLLSLLYAFCLYHRRP
jgi:hypothetical protein